MSSPTSFLQLVHPDSLSSGMSDYLALIVFEQPQEGLLHELFRLQPHGKYKVAVINNSSSPIPQINIPSIFIQSKSPTINLITEGRSSFSVNLISPGSYMNDDLAAQFIAHPQTTNMSWIGYQTYFVPPELLAQLQARYFAPLRLGSFRENFKSAEPLIRNNHLHFIDLTAIRYSDAPDGLNRGPNGLYAEEMCMLARYIGVSSHVDACFLYGFPEKMESSHIITKLLAQILWHLFESLSAGHNEDPAQPNQQMLFTAKEVYIGDQDHALHFLNSNQTGRWWIRLGVEKEIYYFIPCMYEDYALALKGELPVTWLRYYQKINHL